MPRSARRQRWQNAVVDYPRPTTADPSEVFTRDDFANFLEGVLNDFRATGRDEWENTSLERFLDALAGFAGARVVVGAGDLETPTWRTFAEMIVAATVYE